MADPFYQEIATVTRTQPPHLPSLIRALKALDASAGVQILDVNRFKVKKATAWLVGQTTAARNAIEAAPNVTPQLVAQDYVDALPLAEKAWKVIEVEEFNRLRGALRALGAPGLPDLTLDAVLTAWRTKAGEIS